MSESKPFKEPFSYCLCLQIVDAGGGGGGGGGELVVYTFRKSLIKRKTVKL